MGLFFPRAHVDATMSSNTNNELSKSKREATSYVGYGVALIVCMSAFGNMFYMKRFNSTLNNPAKVNAARQSVDMMIHPEKIVKARRVPPYKPPAPAPIPDHLADQSNYSPSVFVDGKASTENSADRGVHRDFAAIKTIHNNDEHPDSVKHELIREIIKKHVKHKPNKL